MKKYSISFGIRERHLPEGLKLKRLLIPSIGENMEQQEPSYPVDGWVQSIILKTILVLSSKFEHIYRMTQLFYSWCILNINVPKKHVQDSSYDSIIQSKCAKVNVQVSYRYM